MTESIVEAQQRVSKENNFEFYGPAMANEAGHIANLTNQLKAVLLELRTRCLHFTSNHGVNELRRCPHCGLVWAKIDGCNNVVCGRANGILDVRRKNNGIMATFRFLWNAEREELEITRTGERRARYVQASRGVGCGATLDWSTMALVEVPQEFCAAQEVRVDDVSTLPAAAASTWEIGYEALRARFRVMEVPSCSAI